MLILNNSILGWNGYLVVNYFGDEMPLRNNGNYCCYYMESYYNYYYTNYNCLLVYAELRATFAPRSGGSRDRRRRALVSRTQQRQRLEKASGADA